jgi:uncharacterized membrane protein YdjX (TVP38/TMEM64 family)
MSEKQADEENDGRVPAATTAFRIAMALAAVAGLWMLGKSAGRFMPELAHSIAELGPAGPIAFMIAYAAAIVALVPGSVLTLAAGALFGIVKGTIYVFIAATLGACGAFVVSRYLARSLIERRFAKDRRFEAIDRAIAKEGRKIVFLLRLSPVFPFSVLNYVLGLTRVSFADYTIACVGILPGTLLYVYYGKIAGDVATAIGGAAPERGAGYYAVMIAGLAATIAVTAVVTRIAKHALEEVENA